MKRRRKVVVMQEETKMAGNPELIEQLRKEAIQKATIVRALTSERVERMVIQSN